MILEILPNEFSVCKTSSIPALPDGISFLARTDKEISLVCESRKIDFETTAREDSWRCMRVRGELDFSLIGILSKLSGILAENQIGIFAVSTFNTDYILVKEENFEKALDVLSDAGYKII